MMMTFSYTRVQYGGGDDNINGFDCCLFFVFFYVIFISLFFFIKSQVYKRCEFNEEFMLNNF